MLEIWKDVVGYENSHAVSNLGRLKLKNYTIIRSDGKPCRIKEKVLKPRLEANGYYRINLRTPKSRKAYSMHRLVCEAFNGPPPSEKHQVDHINFDRGDNRAFNLRWLTPLENIHHSIKKGNIRVSGESNPSSKLSRKEVLEIVELLDFSNLTQKKIAKKYNTTQSIISAIKRGVNWSSVTGRGL